MDPLQQIQQEMARRGIASAGGSRLESLRSLPVGDAVDKYIHGGVEPRPAPQPGIGMRVLDAGLKVIPKAGMFVRSLSAGPVADGTLEHARRMGWIR